MNLDRLFSDRTPAVEAARRFVPQAVRDAIVHRMMFTDAASRRQFRQAQAGLGTTPVPVRLRALAGRKLWIRPGTDDPWSVAHGPGRICRASGHAGLQHGR